ncbi:hypothetical protein AB4Y30_03530 [Ornithinibacillus sp. 4-3]|uniref:Uncharacterized protein n=1 Tax=Ornithinibacillus sp. 4-3 TaxID=3231488 RepID=A0AB39HSX0_9BACI
MLNFHRFFIFFIFLLVIGCNSVDKDIIKNEITLDENNELLILHNNFKYLDSIDSVLESSIDYNSVKSFEPISEQLEVYEGVQDDYQYIKLAKDDSSIKGKITIENKSEDDLELEHVFFQGENKVDITLQDDVTYEKVITITPANQVTELEVSLEYFDEMESELSYFAQEKTTSSNDLEFNNLERLQLVRFFVTKEELIPEEQVLDEYELEIREEDIETLDLFPYIEIIENVSNNNTFINLEVNKLAYPAIMDIFILDNDYQVVYSFLSIELEKGKSKEVELPNDVSELIENKKMYVLYFTNRSEELMLDFLAADIGLRPIPTSFQNIKTLN